MKEKEILPARYKPAELESILVEGVELGKNWMYVQTQLGLAESALTGSELFTASEDMKIARAIFNLVDTNIEADRTAFFQQDLDLLVKEAQKNAWSPDKVQISLGKLGALYYQTSDQARVQIDKYKLNKALGRGTLVPATRINTELSSKTIRLRLYHFAEIKFKASTEQTCIQLSPVYDGGIDDVAYPVHELSLTLRPGQSIETDFLDQIVFFRDIRNELNKEFGFHPEVVDFLKDKFTRIIDLYRLNRQNFLDMRGFHGKKDETRIDRAIFEFLDCSYLPSRLTAERFKQFVDAKKILWSPEVLAYASLKHLYDQLYDPESFLNKSEYYARDNASTLNRIKERTKEILHELGCVIENGEFKNEREIATKLSKDRRFAKRFIVEYEKIFVPRDTVSDSIKGEIDSWSNIDRYDIGQKLYVEALRSIR